MYDGAYWIPKMGKVSEIVSPILAQEKTAIKSQKCYELTPGKGKLGKEKQTIVEKS